MIDVPYACTPPYGIAEVVQFVFAGDASSQQRSFVVPHFDIVLYLVTFYGMTWHVFHC